MNLLSKVGIVLGLVVITVAQMLVAKAENDVHEAVSQAVIDSLFGNDKE